VSSTAGPLPPLAEKATVQRIIDFDGGIKQYLVRAPSSIPSGSDLCPFCRPTHRLRRHGSYCRNAVTAVDSHRIAVQRLYCPATGRTVSLLPDFLVPRKQHTAPVIAAFLYAFAWLGLGLAAAVSKATRVYPSRQKGRFWARAIAARGHVIRAYVATQRARVSAPPSDALLLAHPVRRLLYSLLAPLRVGYADLPAAFVHHSRRMHAAHGLALA
jgi:hypothetical protein